jgi:hypothetical protein
MAKYIIRSRDPKSWRFVKQIVADKNPAKYINKDRMKKKDR